MTYSTAGAPHKTKRLDDDELAKLEAALAGGKRRGGFDRRTYRGSRDHTIGARCP